MDRRTFVATCSAMGLGLAGCGDSSTDPASPIDGSSPSPPTLPQYNTAAERAVGVATGLVKVAESADGGLRWRKTEDIGVVYRTDLYSGQASILAFLAEAHRFAPSDSLRAALDGGARWLDRQPLEVEPGLFTGTGGRAWAFLSVHEALADSSGPWLGAALKLAPAIARPSPGPISDLLSGPPGQGLLMLRLHALTGDERWLDAAAEFGDAMLSRAVRAGAGIKFPSVMLQGQPIFYPGMAHGTAGAGYLLARLAEALPEARAARYLDGARAAAAWLQELASPSGDGLNWYRREPDEMNVQLVQWCHGAPDIGHFFAELYRVTADPSYLSTAERAAVLVERDSARFQTTCQCHGLSGNAGLFIKLFQVTGSPTWFEKAGAFAETVWSLRRRDTQHPSWTSGDGYNANNPGLMTGNAGIGWLYLQLARNGAVPAPVAA